MMLVAGLAADLDWLSSLGGPSAFLSGHRTATHSLFGAVAIAVLVAAGFWALGRIYRRFSVRFVPAALVCAMASGVHLLRSEEHTSELQSRLHLVCRLLLEKKKTHSCPAVVFYKSSYLCLYISV